MEDVPLTEEAAPPKKTEKSVPVDLNPPKPKKKKKAPADAPKSSPSKEKPEGDTPQQQQ